MADAFDPYREWLGLSGGPPANYYELLSLRVLEADHAKVSAAGDRAITKVRSFRPGPNARAWSLLLDEIQMARACLLDPQKKAAYDAELRTADADRPKVPANPATSSSMPPAAVPANVDLYPPGMAKPKSAPAAHPQQQQPPARSPAPATTPQPTFAVPAPWQAPTQPTDVTSLYAAPVPDFAGPTPVSTAGLPMAMPVARQADSIPMATPLAAHPAMTPYGTGGPDPMAPVAIPLGQWNAGQVATPAATYSYPNATAPAGNFQPMGQFQPGMSTAAKPPRKGSWAFFLAIAGAGLLLVAAAVALVIVANRAKGTVAQKPHTTKTESAEPDSEDSSVKGAVAKQIESAPKTSDKTENTEPSPAPIGPMPTPTSNSSPPPTSDSAATATPANPNPAPTPIPPPTVTREEVAALAKALSAARAAITAHNSPEATSQLIQAESLAKLPKHREVVARLKEIANLVEQFHTAVATAIEGLEAGESFKVGTSSEVAFVERQPDKLVLRVGGMNKSYPRNDLPAGLSLALADLKLDATNSMSRVVKGAYLLVHQAPDKDTQTKDREKGKALWEEAQAGGTKIESLMPFLKDNYDELIKDAADGAKP